MASIIASKSNPQKIHKFWVGLSDRNGEGKYRYIDDNSLLDNNTNIFRWDRINYSGHCIAWDGPLIYNMNCSDAHYGLCEIKYLTE